MTHVEKTDKAVTAATVLVAFDLDLDFIRNVFFARSMNATLSDSVREDMLDAVLTTHQMHDGSEVDRLKHLGTLCLELGFTISYLKNKLFKMCLSDMPEEDAIKMIDEVLGQL